MPGLTCDKRKVQPANRKTMPVPLFLSETGEVVDATPTWPNAVLDGKAKPGKETHLRAGRFLPRLDAAPAAQALRDAGAALRKHQQPVRAEEAEEEGKKKEPVVAAPAGPGLDLDMLERAAKAGPDANTRLGGGGASG